LGAQRTQSLIASLLAASKSFGKGQQVAAVNQLEDFQRKLAPQVRGTHPTSAELLLAASPQVVGAAMD